MIDPPPFENETEAINALWEADRAIRSHGKAGRRRMAYTIRKALASGMTIEQIHGELRGPIYDLHRLLEEFPPGS